ncbi:MAG: hypothetical protein QM784_23705 [Polyangiaceae bacterium]
MTSRTARLSNVVLSLCVGSSLGLGLSTQACSDSTKDDSSTQSSGGSGEEGGAASQGGTSSISGGTTSSTLADVWGKLELKMVAEDASAAAHTSVRGTIYDSSSPRRVGAGRFDRGRLHVAKARRGLLRGDVCCVDGVVHQKW